MASRFLQISRNPQGHHESRELIGYGWRGIRWTLAVVALVIIAGLLVPTRSLAQTAQITGVITDTGGAVVAGTTVVIVNQDTGVKRTSESNNDGRYTVPLLQPGTYTITVTAKGFAAQRRTGITLTVGAEQTLDFSLRVGNITQTVEVTGEAPAVELTSSSLGAVVNGATVRDLPLNGRDWTQLASLQPGVDSISSIEASAGGSSRANRGFGALLTVSGTRPQENSYRIDGINVNGALNDSPSSVTGGSLGVDAIREFSVLTSNYSAEYGRTSGGVINATTRSGTNQLHGSVYEFLRNSALDAKNFFDVATSPIPLFQRNQFGGTLGGPIIKNRLFLFGDYEGLRQNLGTTNVDTVPSAAARAGNLCSIPTGVTPNCTPSTVAVDPLVAPFLALWPAPNAGIEGDGDFGVYTVSTASRTREDFATLRVDYTISTKDSLSASWQYDSSSLGTPDPLDIVRIPSTSGREFFSLSENHTFTPQLLNSFRVGYNRNNPSVNIGATALSPLATDPSLEAIPGHFAPLIAVPGLTSFQGGENSTDQTQWIMNSIQGYDDVFLSKGIQTLKFGVAVEHDASFHGGDEKPGGQFAFGSLTDFLTNQPETYDAGPTYAEEGLRQSIFGAYIQDDLRLHNLTVNLGLRYEMSTSPTEVHNKLANLYNYTDPAPHLGKPLFYNPTLKNFEPRIGFVWDPFGDAKSSVRGGFGIFDVLPLLYMYFSNQGYDAPYGTLQSSLSALPQGSFPTGANLLITPETAHLQVDHIQLHPPRDYVMQWNLSAQRQFTPSVVALVAYVGSRNVHSSFNGSDANMVLPTLTSAGYLWPSPLGSGTVQNTSPEIGRIEFLDWAADAYYDAFEAQISKRLSHGVQAQASYTWGKAIDEGSTIVSNSEYVNTTTTMFFSPRLSRGLSDYNVAHNLVISYSWDIPSPETSAAKWAVGGWQLGGIFQIRSGLPFTPIVGGDPLGQKNQQPIDFPNRVEGPGCGTGVNPGNVKSYLNVNCFALPTPPSSIASLCAPFPDAPGTCANLLGNLSRNSIIGPGLVNLDASLIKDNYIKKISETFNVQFRAELFNVLNHPSFNSPTDNETLFNVEGVRVGTAGLIDSTSTTSRQIQFAVKVIW